MNRKPITPEEAMRRLDEGESVTFVDARTEEAWRKSQWQLPHSRRLPADQVEAHLDELPLGGALIVPYSGSVDDVLIVTRILAHHGWTNVRPLAGGPNAWREAGYPTESKPTTTLSPSEVSANVQKAEGD